MEHKHLHFFLAAVECVAIFSVVLTIVSVSLFNPTRADALAKIGVSGVFAKGGCPPLGLGDCDVLTFTPCGPEVTILPSTDLGRHVGHNTGVYIWSVASAHDFWSKDTLQNGIPYPHAGVYVKGYAIPNPNVLCPIPLLRVIGVSQDKHSSIF